MSASIHPSCELQIVRMILVGQTERGQAPGVLQIGIEGEAVVFDRQRSAMAENLHGAIEIVSESGFEVLAPARRIGRETRESKADGSEIEARVETAAPVETDFIVIKLIKIVEDAADGVAFVVVERMLKLGKYGAAAIEHQILADKAAGVGKAIGKLFVGGEQKQARSLRAIRANYNRFGFL